MVEVVTIIAGATVIIVILTYIKDLLESKRRAKIKAAGKESAQMQTDIDELQVECRKLRKKLPKCKNRLLSSTFSSTANFDLTRNQCLLSVEID